MQRYFFHFWSKSQGYPDDIGRELHSLKAAHRHALKLIDGVLSFRGIADEEPRWVVKIADAQGRIVLAILFPQRQSARNTPHLLRARDLAASILLSCRERRSKRVNSREW